MNIGEFNPENHASDNIVIFEPRDKKIDGDKRKNQAELTRKRGPDIWDTSAKCRHINKQINDDLSEIACLDCGERLNPIWVLARMAESESKWIAHRDQYDKAKEALEQRSRCKCQHCGKMTKI